MNEHIAHFNRWQATYLMWAYSNFDRIVAETVAKHKKEMEEEKIVYKYNTAFSSANASFGSTIIIKVPSTV